MIENINNEKNAAASMQIPINNCLLVFLSTICHFEYYYKILNCIDKIANMT